jgi:pimeloyl-ACP methyl ester carboxylesterase
MNIPRWFTALLVLSVVFVLAPLPAFSPAEAEEEELPGLLVVYEANHLRGQHLVKILEKPAAEAGFNITLVTKVYGRAGAFTEWKEGEMARKKFDEDRIVLLGFSSAGRGALALTVKYSEQLAGTIVAAAADFAITRNDTKGIVQDYPFFLLYSRADSTASFKIGRDAKTVLAKSKLNATYKAVDDLNHFDVIQKGHTEFLPWAAENSYAWKHLKLAKLALRDDKRDLAMEHWATFKKRYRRSELNEKFNELLGGD